MKITLMDVNKLVDLVLPNENFGNYWIKNANDENLVQVSASDLGWTLKSNSDVKIINSGTPVNEVMLEAEKFYIIKNVLDGNEYVVYSSPIYDSNVFKLILSNSEQVNSWYIGNNDAEDSSTLPNIVSYEQAGIARNQLKINYNNGVYSVINLNPQIPMYINGKMEEQATIKYGDVIFILGFKLTIIKDIFYMNNPNKLVKYSAQHFTERVLPELDYSKISPDPDPATEMYKKEDYFLKPPRFDEQIEEKTLKIDPPPAPQKQEEMPAILTLSTMMMTGMSSLMTGAATISNVVSGKTTLAESWPSVLTAISMLATMLLIPFITKKYNEHKKKVYERNRQKLYSQYINNKRVEFLNEMKREQQILTDKYINLKDVGDIILYRKRNLWEKNTDDYDYLTLRLGIGSITPFFKVSYPEEHFTMEDEDNLMSYLKALQQETMKLENVPVTYSFIKKYVTAIIGNKDITDSFLRGILLQLFAYHGYDSLKICVLTNKQNEDFWDDVKDSPYFWDNSRSVRFFGTNPDDISQISSYFEEMLQRAQENANAGAINTGTEQNKSFILDTRYVIITDDIEDVRSVSIIDKLLKSTEYMGISLIILTEKLNSLPNEIEHFISVEEKMGGLFDHIVSDSNRVAFLPDFMYISLANYMKVLDNIPIALNGGKFVLPTTYSFLEMYNVSNVNQLNALGRWKDSNPIKSLATPVGINEAGELFKLDLHEKAHGPHGLIAGMTGSGKSEFIITMILSMAVNFHPDEVQFVLIDYKGGGLAGAFENNETGMKLPHLAGTITNLDVNEINRSLASLESELKRRQAMFNVARDKVGESTIDIYKYQRLYRDGKVAEPISHLFIISDEFAELKAQQPEFMDQLISTARIGRSLGVHLILATQKPSGVVNDQIWSNTRFRVCLKVSDRSDSQEVIKRPDAASLKETGRFFLQVGYDEYFAMGQSAWTGAPYYEADVRKKKIDTSINFIDNLGTPYKTIDDGKQNFTGVLKGEELPNVMAYLIDVAKKEEIHVKQLWLNPIPAEIYIDAIKQKYQYKKVDCDINPVIGEYDAPEMQLQGLLTMPITRQGNWIIYGMADSGVDEVMSSIVYSCITTYAPQELNMYLLDFGAETLRNYRKAPQVGDVVFQNDTDKVINLFKMIESMMASRKKLFADFGGNYISYCRESGKFVPNIVVMINGFENFNENFGDQLFDSLVTISRDCQKYGIFLIISCASANGVRSKLAQYLPSHLVLQMADKYDYSALVGRTKLTPASHPGRGITKVGDGIFEFQTAIPTKRSETNTYILSAIKQLAQSFPNNQAQKIPVLPEVVTKSYMADKLTGINSVPIGVAKDSLLVRTLDLTKDFAFAITSLEMEETKEFSGLLIEELIKLQGDKALIFDAEKTLKDHCEGGTYVDTDYVNNFVNLTKEISDAYEAYRSSNFDSSTLSTFANHTIIVNGINKFKAILGTEFDAKFSSLISNIKNMSHVNLLIIDSVDGIKKCEYDPWYKESIAGTKAIFLGNGFTTQYSIKSTMSTRILNTKLEKNFAYYINGNTTELIKVMSEAGDDDDYETL